MTPLQAEMCGRRPDDASRTGRVPCAAGPVLVFLLSLCGASPGTAGSGTRVLYVTHTARTDGGRQTVGVLCDFYGLTCDTCLVKDAPARLDASAGGNGGVLAVIVDASSLVAACLPETEAFWRRLRGSHVPVLVLCAESRTLSLAGLSGSASTAEVRFAPLPGAFSSWSVTQGSPKVTRELSGIEGRIRGRDGLPTAAIGPARLDDEVIPLMWIQSARGVRLPIYVEYGSAGGPVFFAAFSRKPLRDGGLFGADIESSLPRVVPILTFLRFAGGRYCWHRPTDYANLTLDDSWLREPYGWLAYRGLLAEMQKARFHTTIAFIPWNYDTSHEDVVAIFRRHPEHYSLCVHGNNHDRWEFYRYRTTPGDPFPAKPLPVQEANLRQGLARMEQFGRLTGLPYDRVMVFPHFIAPVQTLAALKRYNFLMTVNARNLPLDFEPPADVLSPLRSTTLEYGNFASVTRHPPGRSRAAIALDLFLDNPVLFYGHHDLFRGGMDAFNSTARAVNDIQPQTQWVGLGRIARSLYRRRERSDGGWEIETFSPSIEVTNDQPGERTYFVEKAETLDVPIGRVLVDGVPCPYAVADGRLRLAVAIGPGRSRRIDIEYRNDFQAARVDISRSDPRVNRIRAFSNFRDIALVGHPVARAMVDLYYASMLYRLGLKGAVIVCGAFSAGVLAGGWLLLKRVMRLKSSLDPDRLNLSQDQP